jgi:hypothetical protein
LPVESDVGVSVYVYGGEGIAVGAAVAGSLVGVAAGARVGGVAGVIVGVGSGVRTVGTTGLVGGGEVVGVAVTTTVTST